MLVQVMQFEPGVAWRSYLTWHSSTDKSFCQGLRVSDSNSTWRKLLLSEGQIIAGEKGATLLSRFLAKGQSIEYLCWVVKLGSRYAQVTWP